MKIALFKNVKWGTESPSTDVLDDCDDYIRVSEYIEVDFVRLENKEVIKNEVAALESVKKEIQAAAECKLVEIDRKIGELLALPHIE